jgi:hypothetical protein
MQCLVDVNASTLYIADSAAVGSTRRLCLSTTAILTAESFKSFERGANQHFKGNVLAKGIFKSGIEMQY